jgi:flagellar biosynthetic protein FliP
MGYRVINRFLALFLLLPLFAFADGDDSMQAAKQLIDAHKDGFLTFKNQIRIIGFLSVVSLIPFGIMMMTSFTRISIVFMFLRQALGSSQIPSNQIIIGLSLILTGFVMHPVIKQTQEQAITPYAKGEFSKLPAVQSGEETEESVLLTRAWQPLRNFLLSHVREKDLDLFLEISGIEVPLLPEHKATDGSEYDLNAIPWYCLIPSFMISELRTAFMMGFLLFLPFLIIDMVVASALMSMGMMMLPPIMVSTPFKLLLFIMIDGWRLIVYQVIKGFQM